MRIAPQDFPDEMEWGIMAKIVIEIEDKDECGVMVRYRFEPKLTHESVDNPTIAVSLALTFLTQIAQIQRQIETEK